VSNKEHDDVRTSVRENYARVASASGPCCAPAPKECGCGGGSSGAAGKAKKLGYSQADLAASPEGANLGLGCGNPQAIAGLSPGETVLDLGAGGGFDCFLAARRVGETGRVIGVDMTPEMVARARQNAREGGYANVEFRLGEIEHLPVADASVDVVLSNCVINLSPDKPQVYREMFRVLRPGGRLVLSDTVQLREMPDEMKNDERLLCFCAVGAARADDIRAMLADAGFSDVRVDVKEESREFIRDWVPGSRAEEYVASATIQAVKA